MTATESPPRAELLLTRRAGRIGDELERSAADGWLVYDFRGSNPAFQRLLAAQREQPPPHSTRRAFLFVPRQGQPRLLIHHVDAGGFQRLGLEAASVDV